MNSVQYASRRTFLQPMDRKLTFLGHGRYPGTFGDLIPQFYDQEAFGIESESLEYRYINPGDYKSPGVGLLDE